MQDVNSEIRTFMEAKGLDQATLARRARVHQATVSRALQGGVRKRRGRAYLRLCNYIQQHKYQKMLRPLDKGRVHEAIDRIWDVSKLHADAVAKVVEALDDCIQRR